MRFIFLGLCLTTLVCTTVRSAIPSQVMAPRADGQVTALAVYEPLQAAPCPSLALISHGAGGTRDGYRYLADVMTGLGFRTIVMGHRESGPEALRADMRADGIRSGIAALVANPQAESARLLDIGAALHWAESQCHSTFRVLLGHSMGAETVMMEAGASNMIGIGAPPAFQDRFDAYVALSPEGPGLVFPEHAWAQIKKPVLLLTGTRDQSLTGPPASRQLPWADMPGNAGHCQWLGVFKDADHMSFAGRGLQAEHVGPEIKLTVTAFLAGVHANLCSTPPSDAEKVFSAK